MTLARVWYRGDAVVVYYASGFSITVNVFGFDVWFGLCVETRSRKKKKRMWKPCLKIAP